MTAAPAFTAFPVQERLMEYVTSGEHNYIGFGGGVRGSKALALDTLIPTPDGWTTMGELRAGDWVLGEHGRPTRVTDATPITTPPTAYRLTFNDGEVIEACGDHLWHTYTYADRRALARRTPAFREARQAARPSRATFSQGVFKSQSVATRNAVCRPPVLAPPTGAVRTTSEIAATFWAPNKRQSNHAIQVASPLDLPDKDLPLDPYCLGAWLGDGTGVTGTITTMDDEVLDPFRPFGFGAVQQQEGRRSRTVRIVGLTALLRSMNLIGNKHIPPDYLRASEAQRRALLAGLMDTDGCCDATGRVSFTNTNLRIIEGTHELITSLGWRVHRAESRATLNGRDCGPVWTLHWTPTQQVFRLPRKAERVRFAGQGARWRYIVGCDPIDPKPMRCITVANPSRLYLAGRSMVPTHNTWGTLAVLVVLCKIFPGSRWAVIRKDLQLIRRTTVPSFHKLRIEGRVQNFITRVDGNFEAHCTNGSLIIFRGENIDKDPDLDAFDGYEVNGFSLEEADEMAETTFVKSIERAGAWLIPDLDTQPHPLVLCTFNPNAAWPKRVFYDPWEDGTLAPPYAFVPATIEDNLAYEPDGPYRRSLENMPPEEYAVRVKGDWSQLSGRYYRSLNKSVHLIPRASLPPEIPEHWERWAAFDWGYDHWSVFGWGVRDTDGVSYLLDSLWLRHEQDEGQAKTIRAVVPPVFLDEVYAGQDCWAQVRARSATGITTADVFGEHGISLYPADDDRVNGGRALRRALAIDANGRSKLYLVDTEGNRRVFEQLAGIQPDKNNINKPEKVDALGGKGGDDGADCIRYWIATRIPTPDLPPWTDEELAQRSSLDRASLQASDDFDAIAAKVMKQLKRGGR